ncbi:MAG: glutamine synthetase III [Oscillospiraceae bacterium]|jgi:glutamine synthetase|nr:glutamine synthetase III [Oscillospiraceae bacterium]
MDSVSEIFGSMVFGDAAMLKRLPKDTYKKLKSVAQARGHIDSDISDIVANAMKNWAVEKGATHFAHWFQPMTGVTARKNDSFISCKNSGEVIMEFSGKELMKGEPDASSFPSGGLRATFEARGYTAWDPTSYAFIRDRILCIPTAFYSYSGEALDKKIPLLRSMEAINKQALRVLKLFGNEDVESVTTTVGPEQEYFLIDKELYKKRKDLIFCNRTLFGLSPPKGQELGDHYFGAIKPRVIDFMNDVNNELWKLGVPAKTEHNEVAPSQHEVAVTFACANVATDHNQIVMEVVQSVADKKDLVCLLHEKPFLGINGSGKHNNWSISTNTGVNLLEPGSSPYENAQFLLFLCAIIKAADEYQDLLRISVASAGNDHRLGANEAPPSIISIFLGDELTEILDALENHQTYFETKTDRSEKIELGVSVLANMFRDVTDRNRTSPFAFTGNKFELRMLGSKSSVADCNTILNTITAEELRKFADILEKSKNLEEQLRDLITDTIKQHKRIIFNGNSYSEEWKKEAKKRGLLNLKTTVHALIHLKKQKNIKLFSEHGVYTEAEIKSKFDVDMRNYCIIIDIEAKTMLSMVKQEIIPSVINYQRELVKVSLMKKFLNKNLNSYLEDEISQKISILSRELLTRTENLEKAVDFKKISDLAKRATYYQDSVIGAMNKLREVVDKLEDIVSKEFWPYPTYSDLLFSV